jgi:hypothetical protein
MPHNPYKASCCQEANYAMREKGYIFFARSIAHPWSVDDHCLISAIRFRDQKRSCTKHLSRFQPPAVSGGYARKHSLRHLETLLCPCAVPVNAAGSACTHAVQLVPSSGKGQHRQPGVCARGCKIEERTGPPINAPGCRDCRAAHAPRVRVHGPRA